MNDFFWYTILGFIIAGFILFFMTHPEYSRYHAMSRIKELETRIKYLEMKING
jgi:hypothetical protein